MSPLRVANSRTVSSVMVRVTDAEEPRVKFEGMLGMVGFVAVEIAWMGRIDRISWVADKRMLHLPAKVMSSMPGNDIDRFLR